MLHLVHERLQLHKAAAKDKCWDSRLHSVSEADNKDRGLACLLVFLGSVPLSFPGEQQWQALAPLNSA